MATQLKEQETSSAEPDPTGIWRQYLATFIACLAVFCQGQVFGWIPPIISKYGGACQNRTESISEDDLFIEMTGDQSSWLLSFISLGSVLAPFLCGHFMDSLGRKPVILITALLFILGWLIALASPTIYVLYTVQIIHGVASGCVYIAVAVYVGEIAHTSVRGKLMSIVPGFWTVGVLYEYATVPYLSYGTVVYSSCIYPFLLLLAFWRLPESHHYLLMKRKSREAAKSLEWFRGAASVDQVSEELGSVKTAIYHRTETATAWKQLLGTKRGLKSFLIVEGLTVWGFLGGSMTIVMYAEELFPESSTREVNTGSVILCVLTLLVEFSTALFVDRLGRRPLIVHSAWTTAVFTLAASIVYYVSPSLALSASPTAKIFLKLAPYLTVIPANLLLSFQMAVVCSSVRVELYPTESRALGSAIQYMTCSFLFLIAVKIFQQVNDNLGLYVNFLLFTFFNASGALFAYFFMPETKMKTFDAIQDIIALDKKAPIIASLTSNSIP